MSESITEMTFIELYCSYILACQRYARKESGKADLLLPFAIMTSGDTHQHTVELMNKHVTWLGICFLHFLCHSSCGTRTSCYGLDSTRLFRLLVSNLSP